MTMAEELIDEEEREQRVDHRGLAEPMILPFLAVAAKGEIICGRLDVNGPANCRAAAKRIRDRRS